VARRLAHEIKNPRTDPTVAERIAHKLGGNWTHRTRIPHRARADIVHQVAAMKTWWTRFAGYARHAARQARSADLTRWVREVLALYDTKSLGWSCISTPVCRALQVTPHYVRQADT